MIYKSLEEVVKELRKTAVTLMPYSFPRTSHEAEIELSWLKQREIVIDGYDVGLHFNIADHSKYKIESIQIFGKQFTYLPFRLVSKIARRFLGDKDLSLVEVIYSKTGQRDGSFRKIYVWTLYYDQEGNHAPSPFHLKGTVEEVDGFKYYRVNQREISFF